LKSKTDVLLASDPRLQEYLQWIKKQENSMQIYRVSDMARFFCFDRDLVVEHNNIGHDWQFSDEQRELLWQYKNANDLICDCLSKGAYVSREVREAIESQLYLPMASIKTIVPPDLDADD
jgi:hypothetical protein